MRQSENEYELLINQYQRATGNESFTMLELAQFAITNGWSAPPPITAEEQLARKLARAAREITRRDRETGQAYRAYHAVPSFDRNGQGTFWVDIDQASREQIRRSAYSRREQVVGDLLQLTLDLDHWNRSNIEEEPLMIEADIAPDISERLAAEGVSVTSLASESIYSE